jgi:hypothetical protein
MKKFLVLYQSTVPAAEQMRNATPEQMKGGMELWMAWAGRAGNALVDLGSPVVAAARVTESQSGPGTSQVGGYSIMQAQSKEALLDLMKNHPHFRAPGSSIEVLEFMPIPGM